jgi:hypothetical protein
MANTHDRKMQRYQQLSASYGLYRRKKQSARKIIRFHRPWGEYCRQNQLRHPAASTDAMILRPIE